MIDVITVFEDGNEFLGSDHFHRSSNGITFRRRVDALKRSKDHEACGQGKAKMKVEREFD